MNVKPSSLKASETQQEDSLVFLRQMLSELRIVAHNQGADLLAYLIEMAVVEAGDLMSGKSRLSGEVVKRD